MQGMQLEGCCFFFDLDTWSDEECISKIGVFGDKEMNINCWRVNGEDEASLSV